MVIPIEESLIYVRPLYLRASGGRIPELTRVIVAYQNQIVMEPTLEAGLARIFGGAGGAPPRDPRDTSAAAPAEQTAAGGPATTPAAAPGAATAGIEALAAEAQRHYARAIEAQRAGDWAGYGEAIRQLGATLDRMRSR
jgi:uncharacterized membrane protein (UPF0182 family)